MTPKPTQDKSPSWANLFDQIELTPEEEKLLDALWASPDMQEAIQRAADEAKQQTPEEENKA